MLLTMSAPAATVPSTPETGFSGEQPDSRPRDPGNGVSRFQGVRAGRPSRGDAREREQRFAELLAAGKPLRQAGREARIDGWRAAELVSTPAFWKLVHDLRKAA